MDICPYDNVEFPIQSQRQAGIGTWPGSGVDRNGFMASKPYNQTVVRDKLTSSLAPVLENDAGSTEDLSEIPQVQDQRQTANVTSSADSPKKETAVSVNKGVYVVNDSNKNHTPQPVVKPTSQTPSPSLNFKMKDSKNVIVEQPRSIATAFTRSDFNPQSHKVLERAYTRHKHFYKFNEFLLDQANDMKEDVWDVKGRPGEMLTYEQLLQGVLEEGEMFVMGGSWLYFTDLDFLDEECKNSLKPSIGKGRLCLTNQRLLILSAETVLGADLNEYGDPSKPSGGYKLQISKYNSLFFQNIPLACIQGAELMANVGIAEESRISPRNPICCGICSCLGIGRCGVTWRASDPLPVTLNKRTVNIGVKMPPWLTKTMIVVHLNPEMPLNMARDFVSKLHHHAPIYNERSQGYTSV